MSEVLRSWSGAKPNRRGARRRPVVRNTILFMVFFSLGWAWWNSRDTHDIGDLLPDEPAFQIHVEDVLEKRFVIARSEFWDFLPKDHPGQAIPKALAQELDMPDWVQKNLFPGYCHISGDSMDDFEAALFVSKMTRTGVLLERFRGYIDGVEEDYAGGLKIRYVPGASVYYAIRGRVLLLSASRQTLIQSLTLHPQDAMGQDSLDTLVANVKNEALYVVLNEPVAPVSSSFAKAELKIWLEPQFERLRVHGEIGPVWREKIEAFMPQVKPVELLVMGQGMVELSLNLGVSLSESISIVEALLEQPLDINTLLGDLPYFQSENNEAVPALLNTLLSATGPGIRLSWLGVEPHAIIPMPELLLQADLAQDGLSTLLPLLPAPDAYPPDVSIPRYNPESGIAYLPIIGGPAIEPSLYVAHRQLNLSNSRTVLERNKANPTQIEKWSEPCNLYLRVMPAEILEAIHTLGMELAAFGVLRHHTEESFTQRVEEWQALFADVKTSYLTASHDDGELTLDFRIELNNRPIESAPAEILQ